MRRLFTSLSAFALITLVSGFLATPVASAQQSVNIFVGGFVPRGGQLGSGTVTGRSADDELANNSDFLDFNFRDFRGATAGGEWLVGLGDMLEGSLGIAYYSRTVPAVDVDFVNANGSEIEQDLLLRVIPFTATIRYLPLGHHDGIVPYIGAGVSIMNWHYSESGQFVATDRSIFRGTFTGRGTATGPVILGGLRVPIGNVGVGGEVRWQSASGNLPGNQGFSGTKIDLGGVNYLFTFNVRF
jgi:outer membrane protein W